MDHFRNILFVADDQSAYERALDRVCALAESAAAKVTLIDTIDSGGARDLSRFFPIAPGVGPKEVASKVINVRRNRLEARADALRAHGIDVTTHVLIGTPFIEVIRQVLRGGHDLVIKGAHRSGGRAFFPGADMHLLRKCPCPVWILNATAAPTCQRILVAVDPQEDDPTRDDLNHRIMTLGTTLARQDGAKLDVVNVWHLREEASLRHGLAKIPEADVNAMVAKEKSDSEALLQALVAQYSDFDDIMRVLHIKGVAEDVIPEHVAAEGIDTIVMGSLARTGVAGLFIGNTAETILNHVTCSVLTVKADGFVSPVEFEKDTA